MESEKNIAIRIKAIRQYYKLTQTQLSVIIGTKQATISQIENGERENFHVKTLSVICEKFPEISSLWLFTGKGEMLVEDFQARKQTITLPYLPFPASATFGLLNCGTANISDFETISVPKFPDIDYEDRFVIPINGRSMEPTIKDKDKVMLHLVDAGNWAYMSGIYVIDLGEQTLCKRIKSNDLLNTGVLILHSDNPDYGSITVKSEDIKCVYKVERIVDSLVY